ncbi:MULTISPECIES: hypothetical protein [unclassified Curtobacterium]|uniref:hypothetical protein n=1 Tax=unclassified Curtobacterium TaxID=257496 RepID=UPI000DA913D7|nr:MULTISPECIES: hypothetical protein [unclassified Curtobacterium]PZE68263.1 hypothetical protein DEI83_04985 [Curtobacterium sp. MCBD17_021]WIB25568.1 hypothetical protein DEJ18_10975 [Curtobacterium sp. MCSS17_015]
MANATTRPVTQDDRFRAVQLLPAPATVLALAVGAGHGLDAVPLGVVAVVGALATLASALLPAHLARVARSMPAPTESDRYREGRLHP